ncbi:MAG: hypothetical protein M1819_000967 [Sarea resinae]|nr:MAG: hypothetical protein M1819_000967 [Sarea resinae]
MSAAIKKPVSQTGHGHVPAHGRRSSTNPPTPPSATGRVPARSPTPSSAPASNGVTRTRSSRGSIGTPVSARAAAKRPVPTTTRSTSAISTTSHDGVDDDTRAETAALIDDLKLRLQKAETASEEYQRQLAVVQSRLDDAIREQGKLEDKAHENDERIEGLENDNRETLRQKRELESIYESERVAMMREKEEQATREEELEEVIQRLKEALSQQRDMRASFEDEDRDPRASAIRSNSSPSLDRDHFAPPTSLNRSDSKSNSKLILQKDKVIESLRLELAEAQIKLVEMENMGGGRLQDLERVLLETRMANARLMEDNESFQLLLSEKTLNGDFSKADFMQGSSASDTSSRLGSSLADELESAAVGESENYRKLESEAKTLKDQNKALTLYINNIIERLLQHKDFEAILDKTPNLMSGPEPSRQTNSRDKELPPTPPVKDNAGPSLLQRAKSVAGGGIRPKARPASHISSPPSTSGASPGPAPSGDAATAPSIPVNRSQSVRAHGHRRANSEWTHATVVNNMYRGPPSYASSGSGPISPTAGVLAGSSSSATSRSSFFSPPLVSGNPNAAARVPSGSLAPDQKDKVGSSSNSVVSDYSGEVDSNASPPRLSGVGVGSGFAGGSSGPGVASSSSLPGSGAVVAGNKLRPLRLVEENVEQAREAEEAAKKAAAAAKRSSWMGWFNKNKEDDPPATGPARSMTFGS